jgi:hypothetical protein
MLQIIGAIIIAYIVITVGSAIIAILVELLGD